MSKSNRHIIALASTLYLEPLKETYGENYVHSPDGDTFEGSQNKKSALKGLFEAAGATPVVFLELNYITELTWDEIAELLIMAEVFKSGVILYKDSFSKMLATKIEGALTKTPIVLDTANKRGFDEIQTVINGLLEQSGPSHPELGP